MKILNISFKSQNNAVKNNERSEKKVQKVIPVTKLKNDQDAFICSRIEQTMEEAKKLSKQYPNIPEEDIAQTLLLTLVKTVRGFGDKKNFYHVIKKQNEAALKRLVKDNDKFETKEDEEYDLIQIFEDKEYVKDLLAELDKRERYVIESRFPQDDASEKKTFKELSEELNISRMRVKQIENATLKKLKRISEIKK